MNFRNPITYQSIIFPLPHELQHLPKVNNSSSSVSSFCSSSSEDEPISPNSVKNDSKALAPIQLSVIKKIVKVTGQCAGEAPADCFSSDHHYRNFTSEHSTRTIQNPPFLETDGWGGFLPGSSSNLITKPENRTPDSSGSPGPPQVSSQTTQPGLEPSFGGYRPVGHERSTQTDDIEDKTLSGDIDSGDTTGRRTHFWHVS